MGSRTASPGLAGGKCRHTGGPKVSIVTDQVVMAFQATVHVRLPRSSPAP